MKIGFHFFHLGLFFILLSIISCQSITETTDETSYSYFVAGHTYGNPTNYQYGLYPPLMNHLSAINSYPKLKLGVLTGDVVPKATKEYWDAAMLDIEKFNVPIHIASGNHDRGAEFEKRFDQYFYSFKQGHDLFIILSPTDWNIAGEQLKFLKETLAANTSKENNIFIFLHELIWWAPDNQFKDIEINYRPHYPGQTNFWPELFPLFNSIPNEVVLFAGDIGATDIVTPYAYYQQDNVTLIANGMGGGKEDNIIIVEVNNKGNRNNKRNVEEQKKVNYKLLGLNKEELYELTDLEEYELPSKN